MFYNYNNHIYSGLKAVQWTLIINQLIIQGFDTYFLDTDLVDYLET